MEGGGTSLVPMGGSCLRRDLFFVVVDNEDDCVGSVVVDNEDDCVGNVL